MREEVDEKLESQGIMINEYSHCITPRDYHQVEGALRDDTNSKTDNNNIRSACEEKLILDTCPCVIRSIRQPHDQYFLETEGKIERESSHKTKHNTSLN